MKILLIIASAIILLFSFALSAYISFPKFPLRDPLAQGLTFVTLGVTTATAVTFLFSLVVGRLPIMM